MTQDSATSETTALVDASEYSPLLQTNSQDTATHANLGSINGTIQSLANTQNTNTGLIGPQSEDADDTGEDDKPLPKLQIFLLCYCRVVEPIAFFSIFPFINKMIEDTGGVREEDVGFYSGLIESLFSLTQMTLMISWGRAADRFGRKPVLVFSLFGVATAVSLFGLSKEIWQMVLFRCLAGMFSGTVVTVRAMITENSTQKTQARAFSFFAFAGNLGICFGPLIGGALADPANQYGGPFSRVQFFRDYPYSLSSFVTGAIGLSAAIISAFFIKETLHKDKSSNGESAKAPMSAWDILKSPGVPTVLILYNSLMLLGMAYTAIAPVFWFTSVPLGGYGFSPLQISLIVGAAGLAQAIWTLLVFPPAQHRWGTTGVMRFCGFVWISIFVIAPLCNTLLRKEWVAWFWAILPVATIWGAAAAMSFTCVQLALNDISPSPDVLGTLNAVALAMTSGTRAIAPALFASLFATGVRNHILGGYLIWVILGVMAVGVTVGVRFLPANADRLMLKRRSNEEEHED